MYVIFVLRVDGWVSFLVPLMQGEMAFATILDFRCQRLLGDHEHWWEVSSPPLHAYGIEFVWMGCYFDPAYRLGPMCAVGEVKACLSRPREPRSCTRPIDRCLKLGFGLA